MPEGHTIHRLARDHHAWFAGAPLTLSSPQGRFADGAQALDGRVLERAEACGKHLFHVYEGDDAEARVVHIHLGLFGRFRRHKRPEPAPRGAIRLRMVGEARAVDLSGPTCCECLTLEQMQAKVDSLGPDPLRDDADFDRFFAGLQRRRKGIGAALLDQKLIAGVGNVYRAELLLEHRLHPDTPCRELTRAQAEALWQTTVVWLQLGVRLNRIVTATREEVGKPPSRMNRRERLRVYKHRHCALCEGAVQTLQSASRTLYWCPACQR